MSRSLVTGGAGFIGSHLVDGLLLRGDDVVVLDNLHRGRRDFVDSRATFIEGDIRDPLALAFAMRSVDVVYHLAAQSNVMGAMSDIDYSFETNVAGTFNALRAAGAAGVARFVFASSREAYGEPAAVPVGEADPLVARNPYGASKVAGEAYCRTWATMSPLQVSILRFANVYGLRDSGRVIPLWVSAALRGEPLTLFGGRQVIDFVPVSLAVQALLRAGEQPLDGPVNIGSGSGTSLLELAERILALTGRRSRLEMLPARGAEVVRFVADVSRMRALLGIEPPADPLAALPGLVEAFARA